jgi:formylglycine-generating enzyme required for sulfatase activity
MVRIPPGSYRPLYGRPGADSIRVTAFHLDRDPVTRGAFLAFVREHPEWRRDRIASRVAERGVYLADWAGPLDAGDAMARRRPVTNVSWFAARAYCEAQGKRLPTTHEWEYAAAASETAADATRDPAFMQRLVTLYASRPHPLPPVGSGFRTVHGVRDLHGRAWEWVEDFDPRRVAHDHGAHDQGAHGRGVQGLRDPSCAGAALGALDPTNYAAFLRFAFRSGLTERSTLETLGFRCAA